MNIAICDDKKSEIKNLIEYIKAYPFDEQLHIEYFSSGAKLHEHLNEERKFDIIFMDVIIGRDERGTNVSKVIKKLYPDTKLIFISFYANAKNTMDVANSDPTGFIVKPLAQEDVNRVLKKATAELASVKKFYYFKFDRITYRIDLNEVVYAETDGRIMRFMLKYGEFYDLEPYIKMDDFSRDVIHVHPHFVRVQRSFSVNLAYVTSFSHNKVFIGKQEIAISPKYAKESKRKIGEYFDSDNFSIS